MIKKELAELKKTMSITNYNIQKICGCYVTLENERVTLPTKRFSNLDEDEMHKYLALFKKSLSGIPEKNYYDLGFPAEEEAPGGCQDALMKLRASVLEDESILEAFYDNIAGTYITDKNYFILLAYGVYDVPSAKQVDGFSDDISTDVYTYLLCSICTVKQTKAHLMLDLGLGDLVDYPGDKAVENPQTAFLFPSFNDRCDDIHEVLYYTKSYSGVDDAFITDFFHCGLPISPVNANSSFAEAIENTFEKDCNVDTVLKINDELKERADEFDRVSDPDIDVLKLSKKEMVDILSDCGANNEQVEAFENEFEEKFGDDEVNVNNLIERKTICFKTDDVVIKLNADRTDLIEEVIEDGSRYLKIRVDNELVVNNIIAKRNV